MGWIVILFCVVLLVVLTRTTLDRETARNLTLLGKMLAIVVGFIALMGVLHYVNR